jgi:hypothetical protein
MKKKAKRRAKQQAKGAELTDGELEKAVGGVSNVLKTRHDTAKNSIGNIR